MAGSGDSAEIARLYADELQSIPQIAGKFAMPRSRVRQILLQCGVSLRSRQDGIRLRTDVLGKHRLGKKLNFSEEHIRALTESRRKRAQLAAGISVKPSGYIEYTRGPHKGRSVHRVIMETKLGRKLGFNEVVHHEDGSRGNNEEANLRLMSRSEHTSLHRREGHHGRSE